MKNLILPAIKRAELVDALADIFKQCALVHKHWGEGCNQRQADAAIKTGEMLLRSYGVQS